jgi:hypothetical protein
VEGFSIHAFKIHNKRPECKREPALNVNGQASLCVIAAMVIFHYTRPSGTGIQHGLDISLAPCYFAPANVFSMH